MPIDVLVGEVEALLQAATKMRVDAERCDKQLKDLQNRDKRIKKIMKRQEQDKNTKPRDRIDGKTKADLEKSIERMKKESKDKNEVADRMQDRYEQHRDEGIQRFLPKLLTTVEKYDRVFEDCVRGEKSGEESLGKIMKLAKAAALVLEPGGELVKPEDLPVKGHQLRQMNPGSEPPEKRSTLLKLMHMALTSYDPLMQIALEACQVACERQGKEPPKNVNDQSAACHVLVATNKTKGIRRCLAKAQEEYEGDYTRLLGVNAL